MYLISEVRVAPKGVRAPRREAAQIEDPEQDAIELMDRFFNEFNRSYGARSYDPVFSDMTMSTPSMLRSIAGATLRAQEELSIPGYKGNDRPLLDGLAINLMDKVLLDAPSGLGYTLSFQFPRRNLFGVRGTPEPKSLSEVMADFVDPANWADRPKERGLSIRELGLFLPGRGWRLLTFFADISMLPGRSSILEVKLQSKDRDIGSEYLESGLNRVLKDQVRRNDLARSYSATPIAPGLPADLRAGLKAALESIGIPNGAYSREGFSSGRFFGKITEVVLKNRTTTATHLKFIRCKCGAVRSVSLQSGSRRQNAVLNSFTFDQIVPWHDSFCGLLGGHAERSKAAGLKPISSGLEDSTEYSAGYTKELS